MAEIRSQRAVDYYRSLRAKGGGLESTEEAVALIENPEDAVERLAAKHRLASTKKKAVSSALEKIGSGGHLNASEQFALEAIIIPDKRPAIDIVNNDYKVDHPDWLDFNLDPTHTALCRAFPSIGRIEISGYPGLPYGGTGFVVGPDLIMTNRHVASFFCRGLGLSGLIFRSGMASGIDFVRESANNSSAYLAVLGVVMIHPYWDMALLRVAGLSEQHKPLVLSAQSPDTAIGDRVGVIGYPAFDPRNPADVQNSVFHGVYNVKRLQPGLIGARRQVKSFGNDVNAATHDASTLGGNSGSAVVHAATGKVFALHFGGVYHDANFGVPVFELARDAKIIDLGVNFEKATPDPATGSWWSGAPTDQEAAHLANKPGPAPAAPASTQIPPAVQLSPPPRIASADGNRTMRITIPVEISVTIGAPVEAAAEATAAPPTREAVAASTAQIALLVAKTASTPVGTGQAPRRLQDVPQGPRTFRDPALSLYQSIAKDVARKRAARNGLESLEATQSDDGASQILAAEAVAQSEWDKKNGVQSAVTASEESLEGMSAFGHAHVCALLAWELTKARLAGDTARVAELDGQLTAGTCDPAWAETIQEYLSYYGPSGTRKPPMYREASTVGDATIPIKVGARIAVIGDWGTGAAPARRVLEQIRTLKPDVLIHLGDIYYSGTETECHDNFTMIIDDVFERSKVPIPVYSLVGNHDMYAGGAGFYAMIDALNPAPARQLASFFCLRSTDDSWQILAMDTGVHDYSPFSVTSVETYVADSEQDWHVRRLKEFPGRTILMSHHQLFSAFSQIGAAASDGSLQPVNARLAKTFARFVATNRDIAAWFWGHEHNLCVYEPYAHLSRGRCIGHGAIPVFADEKPYDPLPQVANPPKIKPQTMLSVDGDYYTHGFAMLNLGPGSAATVEYYEDWRGTPRKMFTETL